MEELIFTDGGIKKQVASGIVVLGIRRVFFQLIISVTNIFLARLLAPEVFGSFAIISFFVLTIGVLTTFGLAPALVQKSGSATKKELQAIFTALLFSSGVFVIVVYLLTPLASLFYKEALGNSGIFWLRLFSLNLLFINITAISIALLERNLKYKKLTVGEVATLFLIQGSTIIFALKGLGMGSFVLGSLLGNLASFLLFFYLAPWPLGFNFSLKEIKGYLSFGLNFQANTVIGAVNSAVIPGFVGAVSGPAAVGLVNWAGGVRAVGLAPVDVMGRLVFPACARVQENKKLLKSLIEKMIQITCLFSFPLLAAIFALASQITYILYTDKWLPGLTALYLSAVQGVFLVLGVILTQVLFALGEAKTVRNISLFWAILQWVLTIPLVLLWNFNGVVLAGMLVSATFFIPLREVRKKVQIDIWPHVLPYLGYSILTGLLMFGLTKIFIVSSLWRLLAIALIGGSFYLGILWSLKKKEILEDFAKLKSLLNKE